MTAEIALLNKSAVALAADSAMTLSGTGKIYQTNKLFELSRYQPVGIMIYNDGEFMGVPWETIIKKYRNSIGGTSKPKIKDYMEDFLDYIQNSEIRMEQREHKELLQTIYEQFALILNMAEDRIRDTFKKKKSVSYRESKGAIIGSIRDRLRYLENAGKTTLMEDIDVSQIVMRHKSAVGKMINQMFEGFGISNAEKEKLYRIFEISIKSTDFSSRNSGIVIAGFGEAEIFPALYEVEIFGMIEGNIKFNIQTHAEIGLDGSSASIVPFAQAEMVHRFMQGVDPEYLDYISSTTIELLCRFGTELLDFYKPSIPINRRRVRRAAKRMVKKQFEPAASNFRQGRFIDPIMDVVEYLPKDELANMAEALVNLTSVKRRVSLEQETVGGPIDIAVISKGDGFVWTKRKPRFDEMSKPDYIHKPLCRSKEGEDDDPQAGEDKEGRSMDAVPPSDPD